MSKTPAENPVPKPPARVPTRAQVKASQTNGAKSHGPKTADGKRRSSMNSIKHGLLARRLAQYEGNACRDYEYERTLKGLREEFRPRTTSEHVMVEMLAGDYVQLAYIVAARQRIVAPKEKDQVADRFNNSLHSSDMAEMLGHIIEALEADNPLRINRDDLDVLPERVSRAVEMFTNPRKYIGSILQTPSALELSEEIAPIYEASGLSKLYLEEEDNAAGYLCGEKIVPPEQRRGWIKLLQLLKNRAEGNANYDYRESASESPRCFPAGLLSVPPENDEEWFRTLEKLQLIRRYETSLRRSIQQTTAELEARLRVRRKSALARRAARDQEHDSPGLS